MYLCLVLAAWESSQYTLVCGSCCLGEESIYTCVWFMLLGGGVNIYLCVVHAAWERSQYIHVCGSSCLGEESIYTCVWF